MKNKIVHFLWRIPEYLLSDLCLGAIICVTLLPSQTMPDQPLFPHADKVIHFILFGTFAAILWWDHSRYNGWKHPRKKDLLVISLISTLLGGLIELLQSYMNVGRNGDVIDFAADAAGAFIIPLLLQKSITAMLPDDIVKLKVIKRSGKIPEILHDIYQSSFPPSERRDWSDIKRRIDNPIPSLNMLAVTFRGEPVGLLTWWDINEAIYIEHLAITDCMRGFGIGEKTLRLFLSKFDRPVLLEVEPAETSDMAQRRIKFYERCGFTAHSSFRYVQPPYAPHLPSIQLMLMSTGQDINITKASHALYRHVYGCDTAPIAAPSSETE